MKTIGVIINPNAKKFRTGKSSIKAYTDLNSEFVVIKKPQNIDELRDAARMFKLNNPDYICIGGGDGTIHFVLSELINIYKPDSIPPVLILKEGTMDNIARSIHLKGGGLGLLNKIIRNLKEERVIKTEFRSTIMIENKYCFLFGTGLVTNFLNKAYTGREKGLYRNIQVAFMGFLEGLSNKKNGEILTLTEQAIYIDGKKVLINPVAGILAGTVEHIGMGFSPLIDAVQPDGKFQVIIFGLNPRGILKNLFKIKTGKKINSPKYLNKLGTSLTIKQKGKFEYTMDGDIYCAENELTISTGPNVELVKF